MTQFDSELEANETRARFAALDQSSGMPKLAFSLISSLRRILTGDPSAPFDFMDEAARAASSLHEEAKKRNAWEAELLLQAVVLTLKRLDPAVDDLKTRVARLESGIKMALRFPTDGSKATIERLAVVVVRSATEFGSNPQEQTNEFLRMAAQITESEITMLGRIFEFQEGLSRQVGHSLAQSNWLSNVQNSWTSMNRKYPPAADEWMIRKSALVRLQGYGFIEQVRGGGTSEGSELGQSPYALLPLGREFHEYVRPLNDPKRKD